MDQKQSLIVAYILDGTGGGRAVGWNEISSWSAKQGPLWVHLDSAHPYTHCWLSNQAGLDPISVDILVSTETRPRVLFSSSNIILLLRGVNLNPGQDLEDMVSIRIYLDRNIIITTRKRRLLSVNDLCGNIESGLGPHDTVELLIALNNKLNSRMADVLDGLDDTVSDIEETVMINENFLIRTQILDIRRQASVIRRYLAPQREALQNLQLAQHKYLVAKHLQHLRESNDKLIRIIEELDIIKERSAMLQEELSNKLAEQMNSRMYLLSLVALIFLPLSFLTGLLGINVGGMPGVDNHLAFTFVCVGLFLLFLFTIIYLRIKKWF